ncbi:MAG: AAA family ATPase [Planctomycetes bacterium]|nr:AAA family ATPase [Planctomycetota bacterium]
MSADEAFDNLLQNGGIPIPRGKTGSAGGGGETKGRTDVRRRDDAVRVTEFFESGMKEYQPDPLRRPGSDTDIHSHPTEADLKPVDEDQVDEAGVHGARIMGRDVDNQAGDIYADGDGGYDEYDYSQAVPADAGEFEGGFAPGSGLGQARRVRRFSYLPVSGLEGFEAGVRELAARIVAHNPDKPSLAVTSAVRGEGRTEACIRMALALAKRVEAKVLLADFDIQHPQIAPRLGIATKYFTLRDVLVGACPLAEALVAGEEDNLYVLPSRASEREADDILDVRQTSRLLEQMHGAFDYIVLDCGPAGQADALTVCQAAGSVALVGMCNMSRTGRMNAAARRLKNAGAWVAGMLILGDGA